MSERREWTAERTKHVRTLYEKAVPAWQGGAFGLMASVAVSHLPDALREIERLKCDLSDVATALNGRLAEATAENEQLRDTVHNYKALLAAAEAAGREVCDERDAAASALDVEIGRGDKATGHVYSLAERINFVIGGLRDEARRGDEAEDKADRRAREIERLKADLLLLGTLKSAEVAPVIERFREAFGADVPQAPSGKWATAEDMRERAAQEAERALIEYAEIDVLDKTPERLRIARRIRALPLCAVPDEPFAVAPPVRHARHDRHCLIHDGVGCSREPGCEVEP